MHCLTVSCGIARTSSGGVHFTATLVDAISVDVAAIDLYVVSKVIPGVVVANGGAVDATGTKGLVGG